MGNCFLSFIQIKRFFLGFFGEQNGFADSFGVVLMSKVLTASSRVLAPVL